MIELNLLPKELRKKKRKRQFVNIPILPICVGTLGVFVVLHLLMILLVKNNRDLSVELKSKCEQMQPQKEMTDKFFREFNKLEKKVKAIREIARPDLSWARILRGLNQAMVSNVWLSEFKLVFGGKEKKEKGAEDLPSSLSLVGYAVGKSEIAMPTVGRFMENLKKNEDFFGHFEEIELVDIRNQTISDEEVMMFKLDCRFKPVATVPVEEKKEQSKTAQKKKRK